MIESVFLFYGAINGLLILVYVFLWALRRFATSSFLDLNRIAQVLFLAAISSPLMMLAVPRTAIPDVQVEVRIPLAEGTGTGSLHRASRRPVVASVAAPEVVVQDEPPAWDWPPIVLGAILTSVFVSLLVLSKHLILLRGVLRDSNLLRKAGRVRILVSDDVKIPFSTLVGGAADVVLPASLMTRPREMKIVIAHELHHHRNGDTLWILFMEIASCVFVLNPFVHLWKRRMTEIQEFACDEALIRQRRISPREYGQCLINVAESARGFASMQVGTTCMGADPKGSPLQSFLGRRIQVFRVHQGPRARRRAAVVFGTLALFATATVAYGAQKTLRKGLIPNEGMAQFDPVVQKTTEEILKKYVSKFKAKGGFVVVGDPATGKILAVANSLKNAQPNSPSWSLSFQLEPASVMKGLVTASAIDRGLIQPDERFNCENGKFHYGGHVYRDWKRFGDLTVTESVQQSSNICGIKIGEKLGAAGLQSTLKSFGFGPGGVAADFPEAMPGTIPAPGQVSDKDFIALVSTGYTATPGFVVTPLEILQAYGAIANDGKVMKPMVASNSSAGMPFGQAISAESARKAKAILVSVVHDGTGKLARSDLYSTAGKTSTAYSPQSKENANLGGARAIAGFAGFAPVDHPRLVVYAGIIEPDGEAHGGGQAAPMFRDVVDQVLSDMKVPSDLK